MQTWHLFKEKSLKSYRLLLKVLEDKEKQGTSNNQNDRNHELEESNEAKKSQNKHVAEKQCCPVCGIFLKDLKTHLLQHNDVEGKPFKCQEKACGKSYCR